MSKINSVIHKKLVLQAEEAKELKLTKLADGLLNSVGSIPRDENEEFIYSHADLKKDIYNSLWKMALNVVAYHDLKSVDAQKIDEVLSDMTNEIVLNVESVLNVENKIGPFEPKLFGQTK